MIVWILFKFALTSVLMPLIEEENGVFEIRIKVPVWISIISIISHKCTQDSLTFRF